MSGSVNQGRVEGRMALATEVREGLSEEVTFEQRPECHLKLWCEITRDTEGDQCLASLTSKWHEVEKDLIKERLAANTLRKPYRILVNVRYWNRSTAVPSKLPLLPRGWWLRH